MIAGGTQIKREGGREGKREKLRRRGKERDQSDPFVVGLRERELANK